VRCGWDAPGVPGAPAVRAGPGVGLAASVPAAAALAVESGPATPSVAPLPNSSLRRDSRFSVTYDRKVGISAPPAGTAPNGNPITGPRSHGFHERRTSSRFSHGRPKIGRAHV